MLILIVLFQRLRRRRRLNPPSLLNRRSRRPPLRRRTVLHGEFSVNECPDLLASVEKANGICRGLQPDENKGTAQETFDKGQRSSESHEHEGGSETLSVLPIHLPASVMPLTSKYSGQKVKGAMGMNRD